MSSYRLGTRGETRRAAAEAEATLTRRVRPWRKVMMPVPLAPHVMMEQWVRGELEEESTETKPKTTPLPPSLPEGNNEPLPEGSNEPLPEGNNGLLPQGNNEHAPEDTGNTEETKDEDDQGIKKAKLADTAMEVEAVTQGGESTPEAGPSIAPAVGSKAADSVALENEPNISTERSVEEKVAGAKENEEVQPKLRQTEAASVKEGGQVIADDETNKNISSLVGGMPGDGKLNPDVSAGFTPGLPSGTANISTDEKTDAVEGGKSTKNVKVPGGSIEVDASKDGSMKEGAELEVSKTPSIVPRTAGEEGTKTVSEGAKLSMESVPGPAVKDASGEKLPNVVADSATETITRASNVEDLSPNGEPKGTLDERKDA